MTLSTLLKFNCRYYRRRRLLSVLCLTGIALGVGIVVAVELINNSALSSFALSVDLLSGRATNSIVSEFGRIDEKVFPRIWKSADIEAASPMIEAMATTLETGDEPIRFLGIDPILDADFRGFVSAGGEETLLPLLRGDIPPVLFSRGLKKRFHLKPGDTLTVLTAGIEKKVRLLDTIPAVGGIEMEENLAIMDISAAQEIFGRVGYLDRIDIIAQNKPHDLLKELPPGLKLTDADEKKSTLKAMLYSLQLNLAAMSLLALFVGVFLIYNFSMFSVLSRREDLALLLTLGAERRGIVGAFLTESLILGALGSLLGIGFGFVVASFSIDKVSSTIAELYFYVDAQRVQLTAPIVLSGFAVGFLATAIGTGLPALEVAGTPPILGMKRRSIEDRARGLKGSLLVAGLVVFFAAVAAAWASRFSIFWGFASAFGMTLAFALCTPAMLSPAAHYLGVFLRRVCGSLEGFLASRMIRASLSRTSIAVAALAVALSMTIGVDTMIHSFRLSVASWLDGSLQADLYVSPSTTKWDHPLPGSLIQDMIRDPRVEALERYSTHEVYLDGRPVKLRVIDASVLRNYSRFTFLRGEVGAWDGMKQGGVFISESLAYRFGKDLGETITLVSPEGDRTFPVVAVVRDYSSDQGTIQIDRDLYERIWKDTRVQSIALFLTPGASVDDVRRFMVSRFPGLDRTIVSSRRMQENILAIFDKTFAPTATLKGVSLLVALLGIATALTAILLERHREMTVMSYLGLTPREMGLTNVYQALVMGLVAFVLSVVCGLVLTYIIVYAINYRSFGWSVDIHLSPWVFVKTFLLTASACVAASVYPTHKLIRDRTVSVLKEE